MTDNITLPPLPSPFGIVDPSEANECGIYDLKDLHDYAEAYATAAIEAAPQSQDREEIIEMALCESRQLVLRIGQAYRFTPRDGCKTCEEMKDEHDQAYSIDHARRIEGDGE